MKDLAVRWLGMALDSRLSSRSHINATDSLHENCQAHAVHHCAKGLGLNTAVAAAKALVAPQALWSVLLRYDGGGPSRISSHQPGARVSAGRETKAKEINKPSAQAARAAPLT